MTPKIIDLRCAGKVLSDGVKEHDCRSVRQPGSPYCPMHKAAAEHLDRQKELGWR